jgi:hypothetical protein
MRAQAICKNIPRNDGQQLLQVTANLQSSKTQHTEQPGSTSFYHKAAFMML